MTSPHLQERIGVNWFARFERAHRRLIATGICAVALITLVSGCGGQGGTTATKKAAVTQTVAASTQTNTATGPTTTASHPGTREGVGWGNCTAAQSVSAQENTCAYCQPSSRSGVRWVTNDTAQTACIPDPTQALLYTPWIQDNVIPRCKGDTTECTMAKWFAAAEAVTGLHMPLTTMTKQPVSGWAWQYPASFKSSFTKSCSQGGYHYDSQVCGCALQMIEFNVPYHEVVVATHDIESGEPPPWYYDPIATCA